MMRDDERWREKEREREGEREGAKIAKKNTITFQMLLLPF